MLNNCQQTTPDAGDVYLRYSPDLKHWSSWQALQRTEPQSLEEKKNPGRYYAGSFRGPYVERNEYSKLVSDHSRMDVPWKTDEEAAVQWILNCEPYYFRSQYMRTQFTRLLKRAPLSTRQADRARRAAREV